MLKLTVLGPGCQKCQLLTDHATGAARELGLEFELEKVTAMPDIIAAGVMLTPALMVDGDLAVMGRVPTIDTLKRLIQDRTNGAA